MDYKVILKDLADVAANVKVWEKQGYAPTIEKDIVLETLRRIYGQLCPETIVESDNETGAIEVYREDNGIESLIEFIKNAQTQFMTETTAQIAEIKETLSKGIIATTPVVEAKTTVETKSVEETEPTIEEKPTTDVKVDVKQEPTIIGFYSLPESMRYNIIHDLFNGDTSRAEIAINKMCSMKSIDDLLIYVEEHFHWNANNATAASLIKMLSKKF